MSSANNLMVDLISSGLSLTKIRNEIGPKMVPCGTPEVSGDQSEWIPRIATL